MLQRSILVVGSLNMDQVVRVPRLPARGETLLGAGSLKLVPGGKGANQAVAMARLGAAVRMAGRIGRDPFGDQLLNALGNDGVQCDLVVRDPEEASGVAFIFLTPDGDNAIVVAAGANMRVGTDGLHSILVALDEVAALVLQLEIPLETVQALIAAAQVRSLPVFLNLAPAQPLPKEPLQQLSVLVVNESEASLLSGQHVDSLEDAHVVAEVLHRSGIATVVLTLGARGALLVTGDSHGQPIHIYQDAPKVQVVDTTAAGDCFVGALVVAMIEGKTPADALRFAVYASALKVTRFGAQLGLPMRKEVEQFMQTF